MVLDAQGSINVTGMECWGTGHPRLIARFYDGLGNAAPFVTVEDAAGTLRVIEAIYRSSRENGAAELESAAV